VAFNERGFGSVVTKEKRGRVWRGWMNFGGENEVFWGKIIVCRVDGGSEGGRLDHLVGRVGVLRWTSTWHYNLHIECHILFR